MGSLYRSEEMAFCQMIVEKDSAFACVAELGKKPYVQFKDLNPDVNAFQRMFVRDIRRFDEMHRKLNLLETQMGKESIDRPMWRDDGDYGALNALDVNHLELTLADLERDVLNMKESDVQLNENWAELKEWQAVIAHTETWLAGGLDDAAAYQIETGGGLADDDMRAALEKGAVNWSVGVIRRDRLRAFERILWRAAHHTVFVRSADMEPDPEAGTDDAVPKAVFIVFYKGEKLRQIINKVCDGFKAKIYENCPKTSKERLSAAVDVSTRLVDLKTVIAQTREHRIRVLQAVSTKHANWLKQVKIHKSVYHTLNLFTFDGIGRFFVAECWVPKKHIDDVQKALDQGVEKSFGTVKAVLNVLETTATPPTYNETNKFTQVFQSIVDSYGVASYLELNPAPWTIISFPFLFAAMFGDMGHAAIMTAAGLFMVLRERQLIASGATSGEIFGMFFGGRYIILLMGLFSIHAGLVYNDLFAKSFNIFGSTWRNPYKASDLTRWLGESAGTHKDLLFELPSEYSYQHDNGPYPFGVDPIWNIAENKLNFLNSLKMKLSVILGVTQMTFGVLLSYNNHRFFKSQIDILTVFIPQIIFMACIFIYLCLQIIAKWLLFWVVEDNVLGRLYPGSHCAPSLLIGLINMFMMKARNVGFVDTSVQEGTTKMGTPRYHELETCYLSQWYPGQSIIETALVLIAVLCVPVMLFGKPIHFLLEQKKKRAQHQDAMSVTYNQLGENENEVVIHNGGAASKQKKQESGGGGHGEGHGEETFADVMVHQAIHTIEYVLGCVSHTASYLRLWALSLAHAQLSEVLWHMVLANAFSLSGVAGYIALYVIFFAFGVLTVSILVLMEGLSAFLHALRLHWVEFQSKFYLGLGYPFQPFSFASVLQRASD